MSNDNDKYSVLITGSSGFVGEATTKHLEEHGHEVFGFDIMEGFDIRDYDLLKAAVAVNHIDRILHLAAISRFADADRNPMDALTVNALGTQMVARVSSELHVPIVYASTSSVYMPVTKAPPITEDFPTAGNSIYGCTKLFGEYFVRSGSAPYIVLRYAHLYGAEKRGHGLIGGFLDRINRGLAPRLYGGMQSNDFTYVDDVARANHIALEASWDKWNDIYNIGTGEELTADEAGRTVCDVFDYDSSLIEVVPGREVDPLRFVYDTSKARDKLGFEAQYDFLRGLQAMKEVMYIKPNAEPIPFTQADSNVAVH